MSQVPSEILLIIQNLAKDYLPGLIEWVERNETRKTKYQNAWNMLDRGLLADNHAKKINLAKHYDWVMRELYFEYKQHKGAM